MLNASHVIPLQQDTKRRADPRNGISLNTLYGRALDRGLIMFGESLHLVVSDRLKTRKKHHEFLALLQQAFLTFEGQPLRPPKRFIPDPVANAYHREMVLGGGGNTLKQAAIAF